MIESYLKRGRGLPVAYLMVLLLVAFLSYRSNQTVSVVMASTPVTNINYQASRAATLTEEMQARDQWLTAAVPGERDPFREPPVVKVAAPKKRPAPIKVAAPARPSSPTVQAIIHDQIGPMMQMQIDGQTSGWLRVGNSFQGWTVEQITVDFVRLSRDGNHYQFRIR